MDKITYEGCAGSATLLVCLEDHDGPPGGRIEPASTFDLWRSGYVPLDDQLKDFLEDAAFTQEDTCDDGSCLRCRAEALIDRYDEEPEVQRKAVSDAN